MMGKTHLFVGMATALAITSPTNLSSCLLAVAGGALGGVVADVDTVKSDTKGDALMGQVFALIITCLALMIDAYLRVGILADVAHKPLQSVTAAVLYLGLYVIGSFTAHRTFTHSLLGLGLFSAAVALFHDGLLLPYAAGYATHLLLDLLNKKRVQLFFPFGRGICLRLFYADKTANRVFFFLGMVFTFVLLGFVVFPLLR